MKLIKTSTFRKLIRAEKDLAIKNEAPKEKSKILVTPGATSRRDHKDDSLGSLQRSLRVLKPDFEFEVVPVIRKLAKVNPDVNQALDDFTKLANNGHNIKFDPKVSSEQVEKMKAFLKESSKGWHVGAAGMDGIVNKMFRQAMIGGAISNEWVPNLSLDNVEEIRFVNPENIRFVTQKNSKTYKPYQKILNKKIIHPNLKDLKKLNDHQFKYFALNGDTDIPYGCPPYLPVLTPIVTQRKMVDNIDYIVEALGLLGHLEVMVDKPVQEADENEDTYRARLTQILRDTKEAVKGGVRDGTVVGFKDDHEFDFKQTATTAQGASDLFNQNELQIASALKYDAAFMGRPGSTETMVTILFTKMLAQLTNIQNIVKENLEFGYGLALTLGGFKFDTLKVEFKKSTITDDMKFQQADEIKLRNLVVKYKQGIISQEQFADEAGYDAPDELEPREDPEMMQQAQIDKESREADKDKSDVKVRDKNNKQGTVKKQNKK